MGEALHDCRMSVPHSSATKKQSARHTSHGTEFSVGQHLRGQQSEQCAHAPRYQSAISAWVCNSSHCKTRSLCTTGAALYTVVAATTAEEELAPSLQPRMDVPGQHTLPVAARQCGQVPGEQDNSSRICRGTLAQAAQAAQNALASAADIVRASSR